MKGSSSFYLVYNNDNLNVGCLVFDDDMDLIAGSQKMVAWLIGGVGIGRLGVDKPVALVSERGWRCCL